MDQRRDRRRVVARVAEHVLVGEAVEELEERVRDRLLDEEARPGEADLAGVVVLPGGLARSGLEVGVREDEQRPLPTQLAGERNDVSRGRRADVTRGLGRARERDPPDARVTRQRRADLLADPLDDVEDARREPRLGARGRRAASTRAATTRPA